MANYADDFDDRGVASGLPSGLTERWATGAAWSTIDLGAGDIALRRVSSSGVRSFASLDAINSDANRNNVEVLVRLRGSAFSTTSSGVVLRGSGSAGAEQGYAAYMTTGGDVRFARYVSGSLSTIATDTAANLSAATFYWLRVRINGTSYAVTHWSGAEGDDPGTPQITGTDSNISGVGWAGFFAFQGASNEYDWSDIAIATNGDVATMSTGGGAAVSVPAGALSLTGYAPTVTATANQTVAVPAGSLTLTAYAPTVTAGANQVVAVPAGSLSLTGFAPTVQVTSGSTILVPAGALSLTGYAPTVVNPNTVAVPAGSITLTGYAPTVVVRADQIVAVPAATLTLTGFAPGVAYTANNTISVPAGALSLTGYAPTVSNGEVVEVKRQTGAGRPRRRQRVVIAIDGEDFVVESEEEAGALLDQAKEAAQEKAEQAIKRAAAARKREPRKVLADARKALEVPTITAEGMSDYAAETVAAIEELYRSAMRTIEVAAMFSRRDRDEEDDEEVLLLLA